MGLYADGVGNVFIHKTLAGRLFFSACIMLSSIQMSGVIVAEERVNEKTPPAPVAQQHMAVVGGEVITMGEFLANYHEARRQRYFHANIPDEAEHEFRKEVAQNLIDKTLLLQEAKKLGLKPDNDWVEGRLVQIDERNRSDPDWQANRDRLLSVLRVQIQQKNLLFQLQAQVDDKVLPDMKAIRGYYDEYKEKFTTPERMKVSLILLGVDPWAPAVTWQAAEQEAQRLVDKLHDGTEFADLARLHSSDASAERGGDLGDLHKGMLADEAQKVLDEMSPGEVSAPVRLLKGIAIFRLNERIAPELNAFEMVEKRVGELWMREQRAKAWNDFIGALRQKTKINFDETVLFGSMN